MRKFNEWLNLRESFDAKIHDGLQTILQMMANRMASLHSSPQDWSEPMNIALKLANQVPQFKRQFNNISNEFQRISIMCQDYARNVSNFRGMPLKDPQLKKQYEELLQQIRDPETRIKSTIEYIYKEMNQ